MTRSTDEWIGKNDDHSIPARVRLRVFERFDGHCAICTRRIGGSIKAAYDHITALINGGGNRESNIQLLCLECHRKKTNSDVALKSRTYRKRAGHIGVRKPRTITRWRKFNGDVVQASRDR